MVPQTNFKFSKVPYLLNLVLGTSCTFFSSLCTQPQFFLHFQQNKVIWSPCSLRSPPVPRTSRYSAVLVRTLHAEPRRALSIVPSFYIHHIVPAHLTVLPHNLRAQHLPSIRLCTYYPIRIPIPSALRRLRTCRALLPATPAVFGNSARPRSI